MTPGVGTIGLVVPTQILVDARWLKEWEYCLFSFFSAALSCEIQVFTNVRPLETFQMGEK